ncbi:hypothetical protein WJX81_002607 [Elliptochloris bilobata]|uniref:G-patch domain-containing protein n=1 Tax=Elliptochloris bilobata TaxID=381761 RepID=A0AAW1QI48_9CHLO
MGAPVVAQRYQGVEKHSSGFRLLSAMGWKEGEGLGAKKQGIREHVKVRKKHDSAGVGAVEAKKQARDWTLGMAAFDSRTGGSHLARFTRRRRCKDALSYSGADLAAILGAVPAAASSGAADSGSGKALEHLQASAVAVPADIELESAQAVAAPAVEVYDGDAWWRSCFVRAGRLGSQAQAAAAAAAAADPTKPLIKVVGFSENDQENLYMAAHGASGKGRQGLGISGRPKNIAGARWQGTKTRLDNDDEEASSPRAVDVSGSEAAAESPTAPPADAQVAPANGSAATISAARVRKLARAALRAAPGAGLKPRKLQRRVVAAGAAGLALDALLAAVAGCARISMVDGRMVLAAAKPVKAL